MQVRKCFLLIVSLCVMTAAALAQKRPDLSKIASVKDKIEVWRLYCNELMGTTEENNKKLVNEAKYGLSICPKDDIKSQAMFNLFIGCAYELTRQYKPAIYHMEKTASLASRIHKTSYEITALGRLTSLYEFVNDVPKGKKNVERIVKLADTATDFQTKKLVTGTLGGYYYDTDNYEQSIKYKIQEIEFSKKIYEQDRKVGSRVDIGYAMSNLAALYSYLTRHQKAIDYLDEAKGYIKDHVLRNGEETLYRNYIVAYLGLKKLDSAKHYYRLIYKGMEGVDTIHSLVSYANYFVGNYYLGEKKIDSAGAYAKKALYHGKKAAGADALIESNILFGTVLYEQKKYAEAIRYLQPAVAGSYEFDRESLANIHSALAKSYAALKQWPEAYNHLQLSAKLNDSVLVAAADKNFNEIEGKYQNAQKIQQLKVKNLQLDTVQKQRYWLISGLLLLLIVAVLLFVIYTNKKQTADVLDEKNKTLARLNNDLEEANQTKAKLFSIISHDLRSPISQVYQFLKLQQLNPQLHTEAQKQQLSTRIQEATGSLLETMEDLLLWSKTQMSQFNTNMQRTSLLPVVVQCEQLLKLNTEAKGVRIENAIPDSLEVVTDAYFLQTIMRNLMQNAVKASPENEVVRIDSCQEEALVVSINNRGIPFSQQDYEQILQSKDTGKGLSGLGLRLVDELSAKLNIRVTFSIDSDQSTTVKIHFPKALS